MSERYQIKERIGQGGLGEVFIATDTQLMREVALKRMKPVEGTSADDLLKEAKVLSALQHPNILTVYDVGRDVNGAFVITELLRGETLEQVVARGALTYEDFRQVVTQSLEGLIAAQAMGLVHRDLKPGNLMVVWHASGKFQLKILDFGLAKFSLNASKQTEDQEEGILGSIFFMAPEQFERLPLDARTDLYAIGCIYYFALTGKYPFTGETAPAVMAAHLQHFVEPLGKFRPDLPPWLCDWAMWFINRRIEDRPVNAKQALDTFQQQASAWETAVQAAPLAAAAAAAYAAPAPAQAQATTPLSPARPGTRRISTAEAVASSSAWDEPIAAAAPTSRGRSKWVIFLLPAILAAALAGGFWYWKKSQSESGDGPNAGTTELPDQLNIPEVLAPPPPLPPAEEKPPKTSAPKKSQSTSDRIASSPKPPPENKPRASTKVERPEAGSLVLRPETLTVRTGETFLPIGSAIMIGSAARPRSSVKAVGHWTAADTKIAWDVVIERPGKYSVSVLQSTDEAVLGSTYRVSLGDQKLGAEVQPTGDKAALEWIDVGVIEIKNAGKQRIEVEPVVIKDSKNGLMNLGGLKLRRS
ncbi:MAG: serine/threonine-protein kinase [Verrucomicrobiales bacterium]